MPTSTRSSSSSASSGGLTLLTLLFIGLKLTGHISWSWWWVLSPIWITFTLAAVAGFIYYLWLTRKSS